MSRPASLLCVLRALCGEGPLRVSAGRSACFFAVLLVLGSRVLGGEPTVKSVDIVLSQRPDVPVIQGIMQTKSGAAYSAERTGGDLGRLAMLSYAVASFEARFGEDGVSISLTASPSEKAATLNVASVQLNGGDAAVNAACRGLLSQQVSTLFRQRPLDYLGMLRDATVIENAYRARGWLDARVSQITMKAGTDGRSAHLGYEVKPGGLFTLGKVTVEGSRGIDAGALTAALKTAEAPAWTEELRAAMADRALSFCREQGFLEAKVAVVPEKRPDGTVEVRIELTEGDRIELNQAVVQGAGDLKDRVAPLVTLRKGVPIKQSEVDAMRRAIEDLGLFREVAMFFVPLREEPAGRRDLVIRVTPLDLGREVGEAEKLYYEMAKKIVRSYNQAGPKSARVTGFFTWGGKRVEVDAAVARPDRARVKLVLPAAGAGEPMEMRFVRVGLRSAVSFSQLGKTIPLAAPLALQVTLRPPDAEKHLPAGVQIAPGIVTKGAASDVILLGERCPPAAAYFTEQAASFARKPPVLEGGVLVLPAESADDGVTRIALGDDQLPRRITRLDPKGQVTAQFDIEINSETIEKEAAAWRAEAEPADQAVGMALTAPVLWTLGLPEAAVELAEKAGAEHPKDAACVAARGLVRVVSGPPDIGLADLRRAAELSDHPAYDLLLAETLMRGKQFDEAAAVCERLLKAGPRTGAATADDLILAASLSLGAMADVLTAGPGDYGRRAAVDRAAALIGLKDYAKAEELARGVLAGNPEDVQAAEVVARCELSRGNPANALDAVGRLKPGAQAAVAEMYVALGHQWLGDEAKAVAALSRALAKSPALRNLLFLQDQAGEIHARFKETAARAALARTFSRAAMGELPPERRAELAAVVNDGYVLKADIEALARRAAEQGKAKPEDMPRLRAEALRRVVDDMLILRWAMWRGISVPEDEVYRAMQDEMMRMGAADIGDYGRLLSERGSGLLQRSSELRDSLMKRAAFSMALADRIQVLPAQVQGFYDANPEQFRVPPTARLRMISLEFARFREKRQASELAQALLRRVQEKPETFEELAREYSHDPNAGRGGLWENVTEASFLDPLGKAVFQMKPGQTSEVVATDRGCHIVRLEGISAGRVVPLEEAAASIVRGMQEALARPELEAWLERLKTESYVEVFEK